MLRRIYPNVLVVAFATSVSITLFILLGKSTGVLDIDLSALQKNIGKNTEAIGKLTESNMTKGEEIERLRSGNSELSEKLLALENEIEEKDKEQLQALSKRQSCDMANELSRVPASMEFRSNGEGEECGSSFVSHVPTSTEGALNYAIGLLDNYKKTGAVAWKHIPEWCIKDAKKYKPVLEERLSQYHYHKSICEQ